MTIESAYYWKAVILLAIGTYLTRYSFFMIMGKGNVSETLQEILKYIPVTVLPAIIFPALCFRGGNLDITAGNEKLVAGLLAAFIAWKTRSSVITIVSGMACLWILKAIQ